MKYLISLLIIYCILIIACEKESTIDINNKVELLKKDLFQDSMIKIHEYPIKDTCGYLDFDLNADSLDDVRIFAKYWPSFQTPSCDEAYLIKIMSLVDSCKIGIREYSLCNAMPVDSTTQIDENINWAMSGTIYYRDCQNFHSSCSMGSSLVFIPILISTDDNDFFGWIKLSYYFSNSGGAEPFDYLSVIIHEHVLNLHPNVAINLN